MDDESQSKNYNYFNFCRRPHYFKWARRKRRTPNDGDHKLMNDSHCAIRQANNTRQSDDCLLMQTNVIKCADKTAEARNNSTQNSGNRTRTRTRESLIDKNNYHYYYYYHSRNKLKFVNANKATILLVSLLIILLTNSLLKNNTTGDNGFDQVSCASTPLDNNNKANQTSSLGPKIPASSNNIKNVNLNRQNSLKAGSRSRQNNNNNNNNSGNSDQSNVGYPDATSPPSRNAQQQRQLAKIANRNKNAGAATMWGRNNQNNSSSTTTTTTTTPSSVDDAIDLPSQSLYNNNDSSSNGDFSNQQPITITARQSRIEVPAESSTVLKCLVSSPQQQGSRSKRKRLEIFWSRITHPPEHSFKVSAKQSGASNGHEQLYMPPSIANASNPISGGGDETRSNHRSSSKSKHKHQQQNALDFSLRSRQEIKFISDLLSEASLTINSVEPIDNGTYFCRAAYGPTTSSNVAVAAEERVAAIDLLVLSKPIVRLDKALPARDSKSASLFWTVISDGNTPIKRTVLMVRNETIRDNNSDTNNNNNSQRDQQHSSASSRSLWHQQQQQHAIHSTNLAANADDDSQQQHQATSSMNSNLIIDSDMLQWQRIDIEGEGERIFQEPLAASPESNSLSNWPLGGEPELTSSVVDSGVASQATSTRIWQNNNNGNNNINNRKRHNNLSRHRSFNVSSLTPGLAYHMRLAAINDMGQSNWSELSLTMPNDVPAPITEVYLLSRKLDSLTIGWRRPLFDNSKTIRYEMQLFDLLRNQNITQIMDTEQMPTSGQRTNFMYLFVNLQPGTDYQFHVRPCSRLGCSDFSTPRLLASTLDGEPDEPLEVEMTCALDTSGRVEQNKLSVSWLPPANPRGQIVNYSLIIEARSTYRNQSAQIHLDEWRTSMETGDNQTLSLEADQMLSPNTNYTARVCANNRSKHCGKLNALTPRSQCSVPASLPLELPPMKLSSKPMEMPANRYDATGSSGASTTSVVKLSTESLVLELPYITSRNGSIDCIQIILIRLPGNFTPDTPLSRILPPSPDDIELSQSIEELRSRTRKPVMQTNLDQAAAAATTSTTTTQFSISPDQTTTLTNNPDQDLEPTEQPSSSGHDMSLVQAQPTQHVTRRILDAKITRNNNGASPDSPMMQGDLSIAMPGNPNKVRNVAQNQGDLVAYIADELDETSWQWTRLANNEPQVLLLGDGAHHKCASLTRLQNTPGGSRDLINSMAPVFDAQLSPGTFYTGFVKLLALRPGALDGLSRGARAGNEDPLLATRYSAYFEPTRTGYSVPQLADLGDSNQDSSAAQDDFGDLAAGAPTNATGFNLQQLISNLNASGLNVAGFKEWAGRASTVARYHLGKWQDSSSRFLAENARFDALANFIMTSSPMMQFLEVGAMVMILTLLILMLVYLVTLPGLLRRKRQHKAKRKQMQANKQQKQQQQQQQQQANLSTQVPTMPRSHEHTSFGAPAPECPVHSSPVTLIANNNNSSNKQQATHDSQVPVCDYHKHQQPALAVPTATAYVAADSNTFSYERNCRTLRNPSGGVARDGSLYASGTGTLGAASRANVGAARPSQGDMTLRHEQSGILALARKINKPIPLRLFGLVFEYRIRNNWLREEYDQLPRASLAAMKNPTSVESNSCMSLSPELIISRELTTSGDEKLMALVSGNDHYEASLVRPITSTGRGEPVLSSIICARSPLDADSVWDFYRLVLEQEVSTIVMLTHTEDLQTGELKCAQYWPTFDNEETTIMSPRNEFVQSSSIPAAKFKIRQETLEPWPLSGASDQQMAQSQQQQHPFKLRRLTLMVMPNKENEKANDTKQANDEKLDDASSLATCTDEDSLAIVERDILHFQFTHWNMSTLQNQMRLVKFIEEASERHLRGQSTSDPLQMRPLLVHCANGLGRSGLFTAMYLIMDELAIKLQFEQQQQQLLITSDGQQQQQQVSKINLFQLVARLRAQREMLLSPYRFYELLYQLTSNCIPVGRPYQHRQDFKQHYATTPNQQQQQLVGPPGAINVVNPNNQQQ